MKVLTLLAALCCSVQLCWSARILALFPMGGRSHWIVFQEMLTELSRRGHQLTVATPFSKAHDSWELLEIKTGMDSHSKFSFLDFGRLPPIAQMVLMMQFSPGFCENLFKEESLQKLINSEGRSFDLLISELFFQDCLLAFAHKFKVPIVQASSMGSGGSWMNDAVGNPFPLAYIPEAAMPYSSKMNFFQRTYNVIASVVLKCAYYYFYHPKADKIIQKYFKDPTMPPLEDIRSNTSLLLLNSHISFDYPRPLVPNAVLVGGMHITPPKKLPKDLQDFMDGAGDGVIYFSMGSNIKSKDLPEEMRNAFLSVFAKLKQKVLWKLEVEEIANLPSNVRISKWFPQSDLLAHKNIKLFITHGGLMSLEEALYHGVPLIGFPVFGDQEANLIKAQDSGYGLLLKLENITETSFGWAVNELLSEPRYMENAKKYSKIYHDRPEKPLDTAIYWIEYVLRHKGAYHMRSAALDLAWYQYLLLDVALFVLLCAASVALAIVFIAKMILRKVFRKSEPISKKGKTTKND